MPVDTEELILKIKMPEEMKERIFDIEELDNGFIVLTSLGRKFYIQYFEVEELFPNGFDKNKLLGNTLDCLLGENNGI